MNTNITFTVTQGRSGSTYLAYLLSGIDGVVALHEPEPSFVSVMRCCQAEPSIAEAFIREKKLPAIIDYKCEHYIETSHVFCKGFFEAITKNDVYPNLIILRRSARQIAKSMVGLKTIPGRTTGGVKWYLHPLDNVYFNIKNWEKMTDYQLCYWYCMEIEARAQKYSLLTKEKGSIVVNVTLDGLKYRNDLYKIISALSLGDIGYFDRIKFLLKRIKKKNASTASKQEILFEEEEDEIIQLAKKSETMNLDYFIR